MLFNSLHYIIFFPIVIALYFAMKKNWRWLLLLAGSYYFYMSWKPEYALLLLASTGIDFWAGLQMSKLKTKKQRLPYLILSCCSNLGILFYFKYFNFFSLNIHELATAAGASFPPITHYVLLPLGISFYTFQTLSYSIDLYNGSIKPERNFGYFALYVSFFPQLIAGPIERSSHLIPQLKKGANLNLQDIRYGLNKIVLGFFKKLVIADNVGIYVDYVFADLSVSNGMQIFVALMFFGVQIFCDFSGYTDIAIGSARLLGINLIENFNRPYWVKSFRDFWSRWHMSLTQWIFIYMQYPLLGNKASNMKRFWINILVLATIGFWHGASWTFIMFGIYHGLIMGIQGHIEIMRSIPRIENKIYRKAIIPIWNAILICLSTLMFRAQNVSDVIEGYGKIFTDWTWDFSMITMGFGGGSGFFILVLLSMLLIPTVFFNRELKFKSNLLYLIVMFGLIIMFGEDANQQFIYFQF